MSSGAGGKWPIVILLWDLAKLTSHAQTQHPWRWPSGSSRRAYFRLFGDLRRKSTAGAERRAGQLASNWRKPRHGWKSRLVLKGSCSSEQKPFPLLGGRNCPQESSPLTCTQTRPRRFVEVAMLVEHASKMRHVGRRRGAQLVVDLGEKWLRWRRRRTFWSGFAFGKIFSSGAVKTARMPLHDDFKQTGNTQLVSVSWTPPNVITPPKRRP